MEILTTFDRRSTGVNAMQTATPPPWPSNTASRRKIEKPQAFAGLAFLGPANLARKVVEYASKVAVFMQDDPATSVLYIEKGEVKLSVVNAVGKEAVVAILGAGDFCGEGCLAKQAQRLNTAETITPSTIVVIEKREMIRLLHAEYAVAEQFIKYVLSRTIRVEGDLIDQLFNSTERRLARALLQLAHYDEQDKPKKMVADISQGMLAEMIGTTRPRVNFFMNKFRRHGFIEYGGKPRGLQINKSLLSVVLHD